MSKPKQEKSWRGEKPRNRLTRMADRMTTLFNNDPEFHEGDKCIVFLDDGEMGGICMNGYNDDTEALADLLQHIQAIFRANGKHMDLMFMDADGIDRVDG